MKGTEECAAVLLTEYADSIDTSTVLAIISDFDLTEPADLAAARDILDILKANIPNEEVGFDPSGASGHGSSDVLGQNETSNARSGTTSEKNQTDTTFESRDHLESDLSRYHITDDGSSHEVGWEDRQDMVYTSALDNLEPEDKEATLISMFPALKPFDVQWALKKCKGDAGQAIDELMTQAFLEESGTRSHGIDAFTESGTAPKPRKVAAKKRRTPTDGSTDSPQGSAPATSKWVTGKQDVEFLTNKTGIPDKQARALYHSNSASLPKTIAAIIDAHIAMQIEAVDPMIQINALELQEEFRSVPRSYIEALLYIAHPSVDNARELARILVAKSPAIDSPIQLRFLRQPLDLSEHDAIKPKFFNAHNSSRNLDASTAAAHASEYTSARNTAFAQAASAYRRGKSDHLMGGAAAYYSDLGQSYHSKAKGAEQDAADALVASQSSRTAIDLHGVDVKNGVRIAREGVTRWWHELGESRSCGVAGGREGYRIVTGVGRHSEGGRSKLGPAIFKMLNGGGWKFEVWEGYFVVTGVRKQ